MEEKKIKIRNCIWTIFNIRNSDHLLFRSSNSSKSHGFTLVEVIVVIAIIGVLASATLALINPVAQLAKSRDSRRQSDIKQIQSALELYRSDQGEYPPPNGNSVEQPLVSPDGVTTYIQSVPTDPKGQDYYYRTLSTNSQYEIYACAEKDTTSSETTALAGVNSRFNCTRYFVGRNP